MNIEYDYLNCVLILELNMILLIIDSNLFLGKCEHYCEGGCGSGVCIGPNKCACKTGYILKVCLLLTAYYL